MAAADIEVATDALGQVPSMIAGIRRVISTLPSLVSTSKAVGATGSIPMSAAIGALGVGLLVFLKELGESLDADVEALVNTIENYRKNEDVTAVAAQTVERDLVAVAGAPAPCLAYGG